MNNDDSINLSEYTLFPDSLEAVWDEYCCRLMAFLRSRVSDDAEAEDLRQELFIRVHQHLCCPPIPEKFESWIYQIARNLVIDHYRRRRFNEELPSSLRYEDEIEEIDPHSRMALSLKELVGELPQPYREAILLTEFQGLTQIQLAEHLGLSYSAAKSRVQRAREKLRSMILTCCHVEFDRRGKIIDYYKNCCCCNPET